MAGKKRDPIIRFWNMVSDPDANGCLIWTGGKMGSGYGQFWNGERFVGAHRFSWSIANGEIPDGSDILHKCDVKQCVNPDHLFTGDAKDNARDMIKKGRQVCVRGEKIGMAKLTESAVRYIRESIRDGLHTRLELANMFNVKKPAIVRVITGTRWGWLK